MTMRTNVTNLYFRSTALLLIVYVNRGQFLTEAIVKWLNSQRLSLSGWGSTIDTILATEALALWAATGNKVKLMHSLSGVSKNK